MSYFLSRMTHGVALWLGVVAATFVLFHVVPTDPARTMLGPNASEQQVGAVRHALGLDLPLANQFRNYVGEVLLLNFGRSYVDDRLVGDEVARKLAVSSQLAVMTVMLIAIYLVISMTLVGQGILPWLPSGAEFLYVSLPTLFSGVVVALGVVIYYPYTNYSGSWSSLGDWLFMLPPAFVLALYPMGILGRIVRTQINQVSKADYVRAARARGLSNSMVLHSYIVRNSLVPLLAAFGNQLPLLLTSTFVVEVVFSVPGIGALLLKSVLERDLPMLEGIAVATSLFTIVVNVVLEALYPFIDPRIHRATAS